MPEHPADRQPAERAPGPAQRDRVLLVVAAVAAVIAAVVALASVLGPAEPRGYGPSFQDGVVGACERAGAETERCRCIARLISERLPFDRVVQIDDDLRSGGTLPPEVADLVATC